MDTVTDGMLKGLGQQLYAMVINIADAFISVVLVFFLLPIWAIRAYIFIIFLTELFNFSLSILRLSRVVNIKIGFMDFLKPGACVIASISFTLPNALYRPAPGSQPIILQPSYCRLRTAVYGINALCFSRKGKIKNPLL